jgi:hypothetical protein
MTRKDDLQYLADSLLIDKLATINVGLTKNADMGNMVSSLAQSVLSEFKTQVEAGGGGATGVMSALTQFFLMGVFPWPLKIIFSILNSFGFNVISVLKYVWQQLEPYIISGQQLTNDQVKTVTQNAVRAEGGEPSEDLSESDDMLYALRKFESDGMLVRIARSNNSSGIAAAIGNVFKINGPKNGKWLSGGFLFYIIKTILMGAGLLTAGTAVKKYLSNEDETEEQSGVATEEQSGVATYTGDAKQDSKQVEQRQYSIKPLPWVPPVVPNSLTETGNGQTYFTNDGINKTWSVPLKGSLKNTMILWAGYVYKELQGREDILSSTPAFNIMVSNLSNYTDRSYLSVPPNFHSLKEIVDTFAGQAARKFEPKESEYEAT